MILSSMRLEFISDEKGYGLVAAQLIPKGTVTFVQDDLDIVIKPEQLSSYPQTIQPYIDRYSFEGPDGSRVISWDHGKYMNHCCYANTLTTGYGFEIAIRDIQPGEEVTDDYRIFTTDHKLLMNCDKTNCEGSLSIQENPALIERWDRDIRGALESFTSQAQELKVFIPRESLLQLEAYLRGDAPYISVARQLPPLTETRDS